LTVGAPAGDARAAVVDDLSTFEAEQVLEKEVEPEARLMSDEWKAFIAVGRQFAAHDTVRHSTREYVRGSVHVNSAEGFNYDPAQRKGVRGSAAKPCGGPRCRHR